jgi:transposase
MRERFAARKLLRKSAAKNLNEQILSREFVTGNGFRRSNMIVQLTVFCLNFGLNEVLFLPPYSPDLNPIEKKWAWLKQKLRSILFKFDSFDIALQCVFQVD